MLKIIKKINSKLSSSIAASEMGKSVLLLILAVSLFFLILELKEPYFFLWSDNANQFLAYYSHNWNSVVINHQIPFINFHQFSGQTYLAQGQSGVLYPLAYLGVFISKLISGDIFLTIDALAYIHLLISGVAFFFLLREFKITGKLGILGALLWVSLPFSVFLSKSWIATEFFTAFLPLNFLFLERLIRSHKTKDLLGLSLIKALIFFQGNIQWLAVLFILEWFFILLRCIIEYIFKKNLKEQKPEKEIGWIFLLRYLLSLLFFGILILPLAVSVFNAQEVAAFRSQKLTVFEALSNSLDMVTFAKAQFFSFKQNYIFAVGSQLFFIGPVVFSIILFNLKNQFKKKDFIIFFLMTFFALAISTKASGILYYMGLGYFRWSFRYFIFFALFLDIAFMIVISGFQEARKKWAYFFIIIAIILNVGVILQMSNRSTIEKFQIVQTYDKKEAEKISNVLSEKPGKIFTFWMRNADPNKYYKYYSHNYATLFEQYHFGGYDALVSKINNKISLNLNHTNTYEGEITQGLLDNLSSWGVRYFITQNNSINDGRLRRFPQLQKKIENVDVALYENYSVKPFTYVKGTGDEIRFTFGVNSITAYLNSTKPGVAVFTFTSIPGFYYSLDGGEFKGLSSGEKPIEVAFPKNTNKIEIRYIDKPFYFSVIISTILGIILLALGWIFRKNKYLN